jgi:ATP-dependent RNA helicase RhlE
MNNSVPSATFSALGVDEKFLAILTKRGISSPTPIQHQAMPIAFGGQDVIGIAQTGTGKTLAFGLPMLQALAAKGGGGLVLVPTRELAYQVEESLRTFAETLGMRTVVIVGGAAMGGQISAIRQRPRIVVATPGRLNDHLEQGTITLKGVGVLVLDEADQMLDMGFMPQIERILKHIPATRQTMLFSATMPPEITKLSAAYMKMPLRVEVAPAGTAAENVEQEMIFVAKTDKLALLEHLLKEM